jgi:DNA-binding transcriptional MerR regulator
VITKLITTGEAAKEVGVDRGTLHRWWQEGIVEPSLVTAGGQGRWDIDDLRRQLDALKKKRRKK